MRRLSGRNLSNLDTSDLVYLKESGQHNAYQDALRALVDETDILSDRQRIAQSEEIFEDALTGERKAEVQDIIRAFGGRQLDFVEDGGRIRIVDGGAANAIVPPKSNPGKYMAELSVHTPAQKVGVGTQRVKDVKNWINDETAMAYVDPGSVDLATASPKIRRAAQMGVAASQGDRAGVMQAQKRYDFTRDESDEILAGLRITGQGFGPFVRKSGLQGREQDVIDPRTGLQVYGSDTENEFYKERASQLGHDWLEGGATAFLDPGSDIAVPGNEFQMEHDRAFSTTNHLGLAETDANRAGFYTRYLNSEKADIDPTTYYQMQRLSALAERKGITVNGVIKGTDGKTMLDAMMEKVNPSVTQTAERRVADRKNLHSIERMMINDALVADAMAPSRLSLPL